MTTQQGSDRPLFADMDDADDEATQRGGPSAAGPGVAATPIQAAGSGAIPLGAPGDATDADDGDDADDDAATEASEPGDR